VVEGVGSCCSNSQVECKFCILINCITQKIQMRGESSLVVGCRATAGVQAASACIGWGGGTATAACSLCKVVEVGLVD